MVSVIKLIIKYHSKTCKSQGYNCYYKLKRKITDGFRCYTKIENKMVSVVSREKKLGLPSTAI